MHPLLIAAAIEAAWLIAYAVTVLATWPRRPRRAAADPTLPAAIQVMLAYRVKDWVERAVDAVFTDLARRHWLETWGATVQIGPGDGRTLSRTEQQIYDHVSAVVKRSQQGTAPFSALNEGQEAASEWATFQKAAEDDATARKLIKPQIPRAVTVVLTIAGTIAPLSYSVSLTGDSLLAGVICSIVFGGMLHAYLVVTTMGGKVLTQAGARAAGPVPPPASPLTAARDNSSGMTYDEATGWRRWEVEKIKWVRFSPWPRRIVLIAAVAWTIALLSLIAGVDGFRWTQWTPLIFGSYLGALALWAGVGLYRKAVMRQRRIAFEQTREHISGLAVRKYTHTYTPVESDSSNTVTDHYIVIDPGPGRSAREFIVSEGEFSSVHEGQTRVKALPQWQDARPATFEIVSEGADKNAS